MKSIILLAASALMVGSFVACSNPLGDRSNAAQNYQPGASGTVPTATPWPAPTLTSVSDSGGLSSGGETLTIAGTGFRSGVVFKIGSNACATSTYLSPTSGTCITPAGGISRNDVTVENPDAQSAVLVGAFTYIGSPKTWLRADAITSVTSGNPVATWPDRSVTPNNFSQVPGAQPSWVSNAVNGQPVVRFANNEMLSAAPMGLTGASARASFYVAKKASTGARNIFGWGVNSHSACYDQMNYSGRYMMHFYVTDTYSIGHAMVANVWTLQSSVYDGSVVRMGLDGQNSPNQTINLVTGDSVAHIGGGCFGSYNGYDGDIAEAIILPQSVTPTEQTVIECYLSRRYALNLATCP